MTDQTETPTNWSDRHQQWANHDHDGQEGWHLHLPAIFGSEGGILRWPGEAKPTPAWEPNFVDLRERIATPGDAARAVPMPGEVHAAMAQVVAEVEAVAKARGGRDGRQRGEDGVDYKFRGVDDLMTALSPAWGRAGLYCAPRTTNIRQLEGAKTSSGSKTWYWWIVDVEYVFTARDGSQVVVGPITGEGRDLGDQGLKKAYTASYRTMLEKVFCVPFAETAKQEAEAMAAAAAEEETGEAPPPEGWDSWEQHDEKVRELREQGRRLAVDDAARETLRLAFQEETGGKDPRDNASWWLARPVYVKLVERYAALARARVRPVPEPAQAQEAVVDEGVQPEEPVCGAQHPEISGPKGHCVHVPNHELIDGVDHATWDGNTWPASQQPAPEAAPAGTRQGTTRGRGRGDQPAWAGRQRRGGDGKQ